MQGILNPKLTLGPFLTRVYIFKSQTSRTKLLQIFIKKLYFETINVNFKLIIRCENCFLIILDFILEHIPILEQLPDFSSYCVFRIYPGFKTIIGIHINVNYETKQDFLNINKIENKNKLFFYYLK